ncbi:RecF/RecN/SMC N terminal domain containing protein [Theileria equi strain WA]|uniref:Structural maintenance of chromosomes protein n=1 Tax=Theileria equi strain WA TaxID=1537102 RepID=L1LCF7_THEEQ|nr:RecF/RecN/SMC N terminal domain containing protein [Theileria equi strain WA]EKX72935.1 RecF/RecN/SMC N terminal domain containing protein [Theileria equi strain WA]|eukprot:XP_004832387.1 RecF/RecN/SMC N terminal domain containing protein [Theileria equi strain WA]
MHIKSVRLKGFRTYKDLTVFNFSPGYNAIVGLNGSGKSNILLAISFVLVENLERTNKSYYLYRGDESSMSADYSAYVEITFDVSNDDAVSEFLENTSDLCLKRTFSESKDVYTVNGKQMALKDYRHLLESLHLTKNSGSHGCDSHFIVKQGDVCKLSNMAPVERLNFFREIIGHKSFDIKVDESMKLLQDSNIMYNSLENQLQQISRKLSSLDLQKRETENWFDLDTKRKELQSNLLLLKISQLNDMIKQYTEQEIEQTQVISKLQKDMELLENSLEESKSELNATLDFNLETKRSELNNIRNQFDELNNELAEFQKEIGVISYNNEQSHNELDEVNKSIVLINNNLDELNDRFVTISNKITTSEMNINDLLYKQRNPDENISAVVEKLEKQRKMIEKIIKEHESKKDKLRKSLSKCQIDMKCIKDEMIKCNEEAFTKSELYKQYTSDMEICTENKRLKQREIAKEMLTHSKLKIQMVEAENIFKKISFANQQLVDLVGIWLTSNTLENHEQNYIGLLIDLIDVKDEYKVAVEQVLGPKLFTIVVANMFYAKSLIKFIEEQDTYSNNIRIVSLDILQATSPDVDENVYENTFPLEKCIIYDDIISPLIHSLLHDFNLVPDSRVVRKLIQSRKNCVTPNGEIFYYHGIVSGGYVNTTNSTLKSYSRLKQVRKEATNIEKLVKELNSDLERMENEQDNIKRKWNAAKDDWNRSMEKTQSLNVSLQHLLNLEESINSHLSDNKVVELTHNIKSLDEQLKRFKESTKQDLERDKAPIDKQMENLNRELSTLKHERMEIQMNKEQMEEKLENLKMKRNEISKTIITNSQILNEYQTSYETLNAQILNLETSRSTLNQEVVNSMTIDEAMQKRHDKSLKVAEIEEQISSYNSALDDATTKLKTIVQNISSIKIAVKECQAELSRIDENITERIRNNMNTDRDSVLEQLSEINKECIPLDFSNRLSLKDYEDLKNDLEALNIRKKAIDGSKLAILQSIRTLKNQKDRNITQLIHKINENISAIFEELVPHGSIKLIVTRRDASNQNIPEKINSCLPECFTNIDEEDNLTGLDIRASFGSNTDGFQQIHQLSGGQKTIISLAFILAIHRLQPAPFYLFDEIDAALDDQYRTRVSKLLQRQCEHGTQCVVTTFREQLLIPGDIFYEISNVNGISYSKQVTLHQAMELVSQVRFSQLVRQYIYSNHQH